MSSSCHFLEHILSKAKAIAICVDSIQEYVPCFTTTAVGADPLYSSSTATNSLNPTDTIGVSSELRCGCLFYTWYLLPPQQTWRFFLLRHGLRSVPNDARRREGVWCVHPFVLSSIIFVPFGYNGLATNEHSTQCHTSIVTYYPTQTYLADISPHKTETFYAQASPSHFTSGTQQSRPCGVP